MSAPLQWGEYQCPSVLTIDRGQQVCCILDADHDGAHRSFDGTEQWVRGDMPRFESS